MNFFFSKIMLFSSMSRHDLTLPADTRLWVNFIGRKTGVPSRQNWVGDHCPPLLVGPSRNPSLTSANHHLTTPRISFPKDLSQYSHLGISRRLSNTIFLANPITTFTIITNPDDFSNPARQTQCHFL